MEKKQTVFITGATDGLGKMLATRLVKKDKQLILHGRNQEKGENLLKELRTINPDCDIAYVNADFADLKAVEKMATEILAQYDNIDVLINNAAIGGGGRSNLDREFAMPNYELRFTINYLAQVLLTEKLLPIITVPQSRIINVASMGQMDIDFADIMMENGYYGSRAYCQSKTALVMYTFSLAERLAKQKIMVTTLHPETYMDTNLVRLHFTEPLSTVDEGCDHLEYVAFYPDLDDITGKYFNKNVITRAIEQAYNQESRQKLTEITKELLARAL